MTLFMEGSMAWHGRMVEPTQFDRSLIDKARHAAKRIGYRVEKQARTIDNLGGLRLITPSGEVYDGWDYDLTPSGVIEICDRLGSIARSRSSERSESASLAVLRRQQ
jgi:hypothetical protein